MGGVNGHPLREFVARPSTETVPFLWSPDIAGWCLGYPGISVTVLCGVFSVLGKKICPWQCLRAASMAPYAQFLPSLH